MKRKGSETEFDFQNPIGNTRKERGIASGRGLFKILYMLKEKIKRNKKKMKAKGGVGRAMKMNGEEKMTSGYCLRVPGESPYIDRLIGMIYHISVPIY